MGEKFVRDWRELEIEAFVKESNKIEGINRDPTKEEIEEHKRFVSLHKITVADLEQFVSVYQSDARLRIIPGLNVQVGGYVAPSGGPEIKENLESILYTANNYGGYGAVWEVHVRYETLHPFSDGNGRSGRVLWAWMMQEYPLGFLHHFYYQTLANSHG